jgi:hypothetical protein
MQLSRREKEQSVMYYYPWSSTFFGMNFLWWLFWVALIVAFFALMTPVRRRDAHRERNRAFAILQRRYASGELSATEYEERKARLLADRELVEGTRTARIEPRRPAPPGPERPLPPGLPQT